MSPACVYVNYTICFGEKKTGKSCAYVDCGEHLAFRTRLNCTLGEERVRTERIRHSMCAFASSRYGTVGDLSIYTKDSEKMSTGCVINITYDSAVGLDFAHNHKVA